MFTTLSQGFQRKLTAVTADTQSLRSQNAALVAQVNKLQARMVGTEQTLFSSLRSWTQQTASPAPVSAPPPPPQPTVTAVVEPGLKAEEVSRIVQSTIADLAPPMGGGSVRLSNREDCAAAWSHNFFSSCQ